MDHREFKDLVPKVQQDLKDHLVIREFRELVGFRELLELDLELLDLF